MQLCTCRNFRCTIMYIYEHCHRRYLCTSCQLPADVLNPESHVKFPLLKYFGIFSDFLFQKFPRNGCRVKTATVLFDARIQADVRSATTCHLFAQFHQILYQQPRNQKSHSSSVEWDYCQLGAEIAIEPPTSNRDNCHRDGDSPIIRADQLRGSHGHDDALADTLYLSLCDSLSSAPCNP